MGPVPMHEDPGVVDRVVGIPAYVGATVHDQDPLARLSRQPLGKDAASEPRTRDHDVVAHQSSTGLSASPAPSRDEARADASPSWAEA